VQQEAGMMRTIAVNPLLNDICQSEADWAQ
jgi:hypothetical protein